MSESTRPMGIIRNMSFESYLDVDAFSSSGHMKQLRRSPWHFKHCVPMEETRAMLCGSLAHCAVLEPGALESRYVVTPPDAPRKPTAAQWSAKKPSPDSAAAMAWWLEFNASVGAREIVTAAEFSVTQLQLAAIAAEPALATILAAGDSEVSVFWVDEDTGVYCKARPDHVHTHGDGSVTLLDLKSTADESPTGFGRAAARLGYHRQAAHYRAGYAAASGLVVRDFVFAAITSAAPVLAVPYVLTAEIAAQADDERRELLELFARCVREDSWPAFETAGYQPLAFPAWATRSAEVEVGFEE